ncbi:MAG: hypothetical protein ACP5IC_02590 [Minisyncoccia bacterium]
MAQTNNQTQNQPIAPSYNLVDIKDIKDGTIYLKSGGLRKIIMVSGINFDLQSTDEQNLILTSFQNFINSFEFDLQFFIHSRMVNLSEYITFLQTKKQEETNELVKIQIEDYINFITTLAEDYFIITKSFFIVVPYDPPPIKSPSSSIFDLLKGQKPNYTTRQLTDEENLQQLQERVDQVLNGLLTMQLQSVVLDNDAVTELLYNMYNPELIEKKNIPTLQTEQYGNKT